MAYPPISTLPSPPSRQDPANFATEADAFLGALPTFQSQVNAAGTYIDGVGTAVDADAIAAAASAASAAASASAASQVASVWVSGGTYTIGNVRFSPITYSSYRAKTNHSGVTTDPSLDTTNWVNISGFSALTDFGVTSSAAELNILDGVTASTAELNYLDITTLGTSQASKVVTADANGDVRFSKAIVETVFALTGTTPALNPNNGTIQTWTLSGASTPTDSFVAGEAMTLMVDDGSAFTITWPSVVWESGGGTAPTLDTTGFTVVTLWKVGTTLYGARVGGA
jgi:hypothetical protein